MGARTPASPASFLGGFGCSCRMCCRRAKNLALRGGFERLGWLQFAAARSQNHAGFVLTGCGRLGAVRTVGFIPVATLLLPPNLPAKRGVARGTKKRCRTVLPLRRICRWPGRRLQHSWRPQSGCSCATRFGKSRRPQLITRHPLSFHLLLNLTFKGGTQRSSQQ